MAKKPLPGSPVPCHRCRAALPLHHPDDDGFIDCPTCGRVPATGRGFASAARAALEAATLRQAEVRAATMEAEASTALAHAHATIQRDRERRKALRFGV